jgi:acyl-CoA thioesterase-1
MIPRLLAALFVLCAAVSDSPGQIVAFGASNVSGFKVGPSETWPSRLETLQQAKGYNVRVINAGPYGDTTTHMLQRVDSSIPNGTKVVVLDMGGGFFNDRFHNISHDQGEKDIQAIYSRLRARGTKIVPEFSYKLPDQFKQADKVHLNAAGHQELAKNASSRGDHGAQSVIEYPERSRSRTRAIAISDSFRNIARTPINPHIRPIVSPVIAPGTI